MLNNLEESLNASSFNKDVNPQVSDSKPNLVNPSRTRLSEIRNTIDALLDIRLSLSVKKILSPIIKKSELIEIINNVKEKTSDEKVNEEIDKLFDEYLPNKAIKPIVPDAKDIWNKNAPVTIAGVESKIDSQLTKDSLSLVDMEKIVNNYEDKGTEKGASLVKKDVHYNSSANEKPKEG